MPDPEYGEGSAWVKDLAGNTIRVATFIEEQQREAGDLTEFQPVDTDLTAIAALTTTPFGRGLLTLADQAALLSAAGAADAAHTHSGVYQPVDSDLTSIAALTTTSYGRAFLELANQAALVALLPSYQPVDSDLTAIAALTTTSYGRAVLALADAAALAGVLPEAHRRRGIDIPFGDGSAVIAAGAVVGVEMPFAWTGIESWRIVSVDNTSGSIVVDVQKATYANAPGTFASIAASAKPTLSTQTKNENTSLSGWTTTGSKGDWLKFITEATPSGVKAVTVSIVFIL